MVLVAGKADAYILTMVFLDAHRLHYQLVCNLLNKLNKTLKRVPVIYRVSWMPLIGPSLSYKLLMYALCTGPLCV